MHSRPRSRPVRKLMLVAVAVAHPPPLYTKLMCIHYFIERESEIVKRADDKIENGREREQLQNSLSEQPLLTINTFYPRLIQYIHT